MSSATEVTSAPRRGRSGTQDDPGVVCTGGRVSTARKIGAQGRGGNGARGLTAVSSLGLSGRWCARAGPPATCTTRRPRAGLEQEGPGPRCPARKRTTPTTIAPSSFPPAEPRRCAGRWSTPWGGSSSSPGGGCCLSAWPSCFSSVGASSARRPAPTAGYVKYWERKSRSPRMGPLQRLPEQELNQAALGGQHPGVGGHAFWFPGCRPGRQNRGYRGCARRYSHAESIQKNTSAL